MSHLVDWFSDDHFDRIFWKPSDMVWIGWVDPEEWMHSSYRTSSKHFTPLYRNYIEQKQNISIVCSFQINIMFVSNRKYLPDNMYIYIFYIYIICTNNILHIHINHPFAPDMLTPPSPPHRVSPTTWVFPHHAAAATASSNDSGGGASATSLPHGRYPTTALDRGRFGSVSPGCQRADVCWNPRKHPRKEKKS